MIDTRVHGDPSACHSLAASLQSYESALEGTVDALTAGRAQADGAWDGLASDRFAAELTGLRSEVATLRERSSRFREKLTDFAESLTRVRSSFAGLRADAAAAGLSLSGGSILPPTAPAADAEDDGTYENRVRAYNGLVQRAEEARTREESAHERVTSATKDLTAAPIIVTLLEKLGFLPSSTSPWGLGAFALGSGLSGAGWAASYFTTVRYGTFRPRHPAGAPGGIGGRYRDMGEFRSRPWYERARDGARKTNYQAQQGMTAPRGRWNAVGRWTGRLGVGLTSVTSAVGQWREDSDDPSMGTAERTTRAATKGATTGAGAWAGGVAGAQLGAGIGSLAGPVGTVVGGVVGGVIGGAIGAGVGEWVGDQLVDVAGDAGEVVGDAAEDVGEFLGDAASGAGDAIGDAWDGLWD
ncbi:WXG100 family type VII secretion target [Cellulomonas aerilata]|uniref:WXG100 family type VII secretion target n=1 Tax=Cellulomonas aerilata TaxID=515326 RepID=A0A512DFJ8_9CELL|nr:WXG100 family type VII secretion target [Cellulomonas aerilata]GEO35235.1 hypothetical protein CAE01nite_29600 [Cellulomonas aerilata]